MSGCCSPGSRLLTPLHCGHQVINCKVQGGKPFLWEQEVEAETGRVILRGHYVVDRKLHRISLTREGMIRVLALLGALQTCFANLCVYLLDAT